MEWKGPKTRIGGSTLYLLGQGAKSCGIGYADAAPAYASAKHIVLTSRSCSTP